MVIQMNKVSIPADALGLHHSTLPTTIVPDSRDPLQINGHIQATWSSVVGEPEGLRSPEWAWKFSGEVFSFIQAATYRFFVIILGPLLSFLAAIHFGILHFLQIWFLRPILKFFHVVFAFTRSFIEITLNGTVGPFVETAGLFCSRFRVRHQRVYDAKDEPAYPFII
ncbi:caveolin-2 [Folsomia candida]|uniref:Caveolin n=1 Tax=Folsomia candida TaxID=158441 RepID=A0A226D092_FOLCA|nr:caveolin-2 [Folsomia candida]OXA38071.1 Caveolin-2 [Folsomia candida]